ncbi:MAG: crossover junction endodeoxyribonuclease RuvC, partial [Mycobacteriales bacterium]
MRVMGVDPGLTRCGIGIVDGTPGRSCSLVHVEVVGTAPTADIAERLLRLENAFVAAMQTYAPDVVAVERVFSQHNVRTAMGTAQVGGIVALAAARRGLPVAFHTP